MRERRQRAAEGMPTCEVIGPEHPSFTSLLNPESDAYVHPVSKVFTDILSKFSALDSLPERVAALHVMFHISKCFPPISRSPSLETAREEKRNPSRVSKLR